MSSRTVVVGLLLLLSALVAVFSSMRSAMDTTPAADRVMGGVAAPASPAPTQRSPDGVLDVATSLQVPLSDSPARLAQDVRNAADFRTALERARAEFDPDARLVNVLIEEVRVACSIVRRPDDVSVRVQADPNRRIWADELMRRCAGLVDADLEPRDLPAHALVDWNRQLPEVVAAQDSTTAALDLARAHISGSADPGLLIESLRFLLERDELPVGAVFVGVAVPANTDIDSALMAAADWIACTRSATCGADGLWTLYTCAQFGCPPGSDLPHALLRTLPPQQFETAQRLVRWALHR